MMIARPKSNLVKIKLAIPTARHFLSRFLLFSARIRQLSALCIVITPHPARRLVSLVVQLHGITRVRCQKHYRDCHDDKG